MIDPNLKRAVWLTAQQRNELADAATRAYATDGADPDICQSVVSEVLSVDERMMSFHGKIQSVIKLLEMPDDSLPLYLSHIEIEEIVVFGELSLDLADFIDPPIPQNIFYDAPNYD